MYDSAAEVFSILATSRSCGNIHCSYQHYQPGKITLHFSVLMIEYLVPTSYQLWMMLYVLYFAASMTIAAEIVIEKSSICVWQKVSSKKKSVDSELRNFLSKGLSFSKSG